MSYSPLVTDTLLYPPDSSKTRILGLRTAFEQARIRRCDHIGGILHGLLARLTEWGRPIRLYLFGPTRTFLERRNQPVDEQLPLWFELVHERILLNTLAEVLDRLSQAVL